MLKAEGELAALERALAYSAARSDIECYCQPVSEERCGYERWYDTEAVRHGNDEFIATAVRYLDLRGLIERHENGVWVRVRNEA